jgi:crossover junction endodeoxyribonuclease RusA
VTGEVGRWVVGLSWDEPPLSLNVHLLRQHQNRVASEVRAEACTRVRAAGIPRQERVRVTLHWQPKTDRTRDVENPVATLKPVCGGIVDAGVVDDNDPPRMVKEMPVIHRRSRTGGGRMCGW